MDSKDEDQRTALMVAAEEGHTEIAKSLITAGASMYSTTDDLQNTALHYSANNC